MSPQALSSPPDPAAEPSRVLEGLLGVEIRHLAALAAIAEARSFRGAAEDLGYVQSAVSQQLARLEKLVGLRLVERARGHAQVEITEPGRILLSHAERVLAQLGAASADLARHRARAVPGLRVGLLPAVATRILPALLADLGPQAAAGVTTSEHADDRALFGAVEGGELDLAFAELPLLPGPFEHRRLLSEDCVLLVPADSPLRGASAATPADLGSEIDLVSRPGWRHGELLEAGLRAAGARLLHPCAADSDASAAALVAAGLASALLPRGSVGEADPRTCVVELDGVLAPRRLALLWHRQRRLGDGLDAFLASAEAVSNRLDWAGRAHGSSTVARSSGAASPRALSAAGRKPRPEIPRRRRRSASE